MLRGMSSVPVLYRVAVRALRRSAPLLAFGGSKVARGIRGRSEALETLVGWGRRERDPGRPTVWFHAPSVGEGLQAGAVLGALAELHRGVQVVFTHFSPSAEGLGDRLGADVSAYLPWDVEELVGSALDEVRPDLLAFTKTEVWPVLVQEAERRDVPVAIVGASVPTDAGRLKWPARTALRGTWAGLAAACANTTEDGEGLKALGVDPSVVHVTGDPGIDSAALRAGAADPEAPHLAPFHASGRPTVVAGSTWPADEDVLVPAWISVRRAHPTALLVVAPHEPEQAHVEALLERLRGFGMAAVTLGSIERRGSVDGVDAVVVDRVGVLAHLYTVGDVAYVGGGFGRDGLHSVLEPAAAGLPTVFGPRHERSRAARQLIEAGGALEVADGESLERALRDWLVGPEHISKAAQCALNYIGAHLGAAERTAHLLDPFIRAAGLA
jgi:3-deoxy-D-manno-octulosonic-acid transferase